MDRLEVMDGKGQIIVDRPVAGAPLIQSRE